MGWYIWPEKRQNWPVLVAECYICHGRIKAGIKYYLMTDELVAHATCVWKREERP